MYGTVILPNKTTNYCQFDTEKLTPIINKKESALLEIENNLKSSNDEKEILENLYIIDRMLDKGVKGVDKLYPTLSKFNNTDSPNIQTFLAGIYRKTKIPDAFGPLFAMLIRNSLRENKNQLFDPNEEIGGAILDYLA